MRKTEISTPAPLNDGSCFSFPAFQFSAFLHAVNPRSPSAFALSTLLHVALVLAVLYFSSISAREKAPVVTETFEVVAGPGDDYTSTAAPKLGNPTGIEFDAPAPLPALPAPPEPEPPAPPAPPAPATPPVPVPVTPVEVAPAAVEPIKLPPIKPPKPKKTKEPAKPKQPATDSPAADATPAKPSNTSASRTTSYTDFQKQNPGVGKSHTSQTSPNARSGASAGPPVTARKIDTKGFRDGLRDGTSTTSRGAGGTALTRAEQSILDSYFAYVKQQIRNAHEKPPGLSDSLSTDVAFMLSASGNVSQVRIVRTSGSNEFDDSVVAAVKRVRLRPRPDNKSELLSLTFKMVEER